MPLRLNSQRGPKHPKKRPLSTWSLGPRLAPRAIFFYFPAAASAMSAGCCLSLSASARALAWAAGSSWRVRVPALHNLPCTLHFSAFSEPEARWPVIKHRIFFLQQSRKVPSFSSSGRATSDLVRVSPRDVERVRMGICATHCVRGKTLSSEPSVPKVGAKQAPFSTWRGRHFFFLQAS